MGMKTAPYIGFPLAINSGIIIQFFYIRTSSATKNGTITFPISFSVNPSGLATISNNASTNNVVCFDIQGNTCAYWHSLNTWPWFYALFIGY